MCCPQAGYTALVCCGAICRDGAEKILEQKKQDDVRSGQKPVPSLFNTCPQLGVVGGEDSHEGDKVKALNLTWITISLWAGLCLLCHTLFFQKYLSRNTYAHSFDRHK